MRVDAGVPHNSHGTSSHEHEGGGRRVQELVIRLRRRRQREGGGADGRGDLELLLPGPLAPRLNIIYINT